MKETSQRSQCEKRIRSKKPMIRITTHDTRKYPGATDVDLHEADSSFLCEETGVRQSLCGRRRVGVSGGLVHPGDIKAGGGVGGRFRLANKRSSRRSEREVVGKLSRRNAGVALQLDFGLSLGGLRQRSWRSLMIRRHRSGRLVEAVH